MDFVTFNQNFSILFGLLGALPQTPPCMDPNGDGTLFCPLRNKFLDTTLAKSCHYFPCVCYMAMPRYCDDDDCDSKVLAAAAAHHIHRHPPHQSLVPRRLMVLLRAVHRQWLRLQQLATQLPSLRRRTASPSTTRSASWLSARNLPTNTCSLFDQKRSRLLVETRNSLVYRKTWRNRNNMWTERAKRLQRSRAE